MNNRIATTRTPIQLAQQRHFTAVTSNEVWLWIAQQLNITLNVKLNIDQAYKSVRTDKAKNHPLSLHSLFI